MSVVPDTNVWITWLGRSPAGFWYAAGGRARIFLTTIALQELWAGVRTAAERASCEQLYELARRRRRLLTPPGPAWVLSGQALNVLARRGGLGAARLRAMRNDVLLAATAVAHGAVVVTENRADFARIAEVLPVRVVSRVEIGGGRR